MRSERIRALLGVWAPLAIGLAIIGTAVNFYFTADLSDGVLARDVESWRFVCTAGAFFLGAVMVLSTYGRHKKTKAAREEPPAADEPPE